MFMFHKNKISMEDNRAIGGMITYQLILGKINEIMSRNDNDHSEIEEVKNYIYENIMPNTAGKLFGKN